MKLFIVLCLAAMAVAAPQVTEKRYHYSPENVQLLRIDSEADDDGSYRFAFEQSDGTKQEQEGKVINPGTKEETIAMKGSYTWIGPDGNAYNVIYTADDDGFKPILEQGPGGAIPQDVIDLFRG